MKHLINKLATLWAIIWSRAWVLVIVKKEKTYVHGDLSADELDDCITHLIDAAEVDRQEFVNAMEVKRMINGGN